jgi:hypothetical protein
VQLLTSGHIFPPGTDQDTIRGSIFGQLPMPWEPSDGRSKGPERTPMQASVAACFARDAARRPTAAALTEKWSSLAGYAATVDAGGGGASGAVSTPEDSSAFAGADSALSAQS